MAYDTIRELIAEKLQSASAAMKVHEHYRFTLEPYASEEFQEMFMNNNDIICAIINRNSFQDFQGNEDNRLMRRHDILVTIYRSFQDTDATKSEDEFNDLLEDISTTFTSDRTLNDNVLAVSLPDFTAVDDIGNLGNRKIPLHRCIMRLMVDEVIEL